MKKSDFFLSIYNLFLQVRWSTLYRVNLPSRGFYWMKLFFFCMSRIHTHQPKRQLSKSYVLVAGNLIFAYTHTHTPKNSIVAKRKLNLFMEINVHVISSEIRWFNSWKGVIVAWWWLLLGVDDLMALKYSWYHEYFNH